MIKRIDALLDRITMYRLVLYVLIGLLGMATVLAFFHMLVFSPLALLGSTLFLLIMCWAVNTALAFVFRVPVNVESASITALILALILDPAQSPRALQLLGWVAILAMSSKYILAIKKHLFNPAAIAVVISAFVIGESASWWVGTASMLPVVLLGGWLIARKLRQEDTVWIFCLVVLTGVCVLTSLQGGSVLTALKQLLVQSPLFFFACIMLTEPLTAPPTRLLRRLFAVLVGILFLPQLHVGSLYSTPELALIGGNLFAYLVSPKQRVVLMLCKKTKLAPNIIDFVFKPSEALKFLPGQYMEFTLAHPRTDSRGNRRYFTLASSPTEPLIHLGVRFYERSSSFKQALYNIDRNTKLVAAQIAGDFTLPDDRHEKLVFLAGGIGITPFRSMLKYLIDTHQSRDIILFYVNRTANEIVFQDVLDMAAIKLGIRVFYTLTDSTAIPSGWRGFVGRIDEQMLLRAVPDYLERTFYISGPPEMVRVSEQILRRVDVEGGRIKKDFFPGLV